LIIPAGLRADRRHSATPDDQRNVFQRDRDRILYCSAFRRLAGITQIARAGEADVFHTRLPHTLKVGQVGRRLAEFVIQNQPKECAALGVHAEVVEAACLAHDLGHPPFGHLGEEVLNRLVTAQHEADGFEGNAQSFRILTSSAVRFTDCDGLDLSRATLAACIKYPWLRDNKDPNSKKAKKWGVYSTEMADFHFARNGSALETKTAEAELMDWADDIAYSVHDLEDFHRCGLIPWRAIFSAEGCDRLVASAMRSQLAQKSSAKTKLKAAHGRIASLVSGTFGDLLDSPYEGTRDQRQAIRLLTSSLIGRYVKSVHLHVPTADGEVTIQIPKDIENEIAILKQIAREYIISMPALAAQQRGQQRILDDLFHDLLEAGSEKYVPKRFLHLMQATGASRARCVGDCISTLTETETVALHGRLRGSASGSVLDPIAR
jgi:dGTPase